MSKRKSKSSYATAQRRRNERLRAILTKYRSEKFYAEIRRHTRQLA